MRKIFFIFLWIINGVLLNAQTMAPQYNASKFGIKSDGITMNTRSIQKAIDWISEKGGGELTFWVGRYLTGTIHLKSNVTLHFMEGAVLSGSTNPYDYDKVCGCYALIIGEKCDSIRIIGKGNILGNGRELANNFTEQVHAGVLQDRLSNDRVGTRARLIYLRECQHVTVKDVTLKEASDWVQTYDQCENVVIDHIFVESVAYWNNDGIDIVDCNHVLLENSYFNSSDDAICLKSHSKDALCQNIEVRNCTARSSASGIKFGTFGLGGFKNVKIINNKVYNTFRSAITIQSVDGGICENILVDSLYATNVGNAIYLIVGNRRQYAGSMRNITIRNLYCEVAAAKPDAGYDYEGPIEDNPRNISPSQIIGLPDSKIDSVFLENITIIYPGGGDPFIAHIGLNELDKVPEMPTAYPEFSQFKELPAWGFYIRHARNIFFKNVIISALKQDYRTPVVMDDVQTIVFDKMQVKVADKNLKDWQYKR